MVAATFALVGIGVFGAPASVAAQTLPPTTVPVTTIPPAANGGVATTPSDGNVNIDLDLGSLAEDSDPTATGEDRKPSRSIVIFLLLTVLSVAPSLLICMTSFTRIMVVLSIARNAVGLQTIPPNQVLTGLAFFLSLFVMAPTLKATNDTALQPYLRGDIKQSQALKAAEKPIKKFMLQNTRKSELDLMTKASKSEKPDRPEDLSLTTVIPGLHPLRVEVSVHHRCHGAAAVPDHRSRRVGGPDESRHDDVAAGIRVVAVQVVAVRHGGRVGADRARTHRQLQVRPR